VIYPVIEPICNPIFAYAILGETLELFAYIGGLMVLTGVIGRGVLQIKKP
jgi:drug/metabolite transporter (DMT)-like permease